MKICGYVPVHYGAEYLRECVEALAPHVDRLIVLYTPTPSFGQSDGVPCPDSEEKLRACCDGVNVEWIGGQWGSEGDHRNTILSLAGDADLIVSADTDEVWDEPSLSRCIHQAYDGAAGRYLINGFVHFWRSFNWCCRDVWSPVRIQKPRGGGDTTIDGTVYHFGYAQAEATVKYKIGCHGHKSEWRSDWWRDIFLANRKTDLHPVVRDWWNAEPFNKWNLPLALKNHPNYAKNLIR